MSCNNCSSCCETEDVQQFVPGKEYVAGEFFKYGKCTYKVVDGSYDDSCLMCDLRVCNEEFKCTRYKRSDSNDVEAILYDSEE